MNIVIDLELEEVIQDLSNRNPIDSIEVKSQDTPLMAVYFVQRGTTFNLGPSPGIRFGLFAPGNPNPLVLCSSFTQTTDQQNRTCYRGYPNFNTANLAGAIGTASTFAAVGEWRYQTSGGTISRTQDVNFTIQRVLLSETILDDTTAAFTVPAVGSNVTIAQGSTGWLSPGLVLTIGAGAGAYTVVSITDGTHYVAQNNGGTGNAAPGTVIPSGTTVGIAPATVLNTYPDPSTIELLPHKGAANGYAGLDVNRLLSASNVPVDGATIVTTAGGKIASGYILATVAANFTTPAANATVSVTLNSTTSLVAGMYVRIPIAGYYIVNSITDATHAVLQNNGDPFNAGTGVTITTGAVLLPAQAAAGGGTAGQNAFSTLLAGFVVPASGATVSVNMGSTAWLGGSGYVVFIAGAGYYSVSSITDATHALLMNLGYAATNAIAGTSIPTGAPVSPGGLQGPASTAVGANAYDTTQASFTMPAAAASVSVAITNTNWLGVGQEVFIAGAGYFSVQSISSPTVFAATNSNYPGAAAPGATIASGAHVSPAGLIGPQGAGGAGLNAFTTLSANFTQPAAGNTVTVTVGTTAWMVATEVIYIAGGGYYQISSIGDLTHVTVTNLGYTGNAASGATVTGSGTQGVSPAGLIGPSGSNPYTSTTASFTMPASGASVTVTVGATAFMVAGQYVYAQGAGYFTVASITDTTHAVLTNNTGATGNVASGTVIASGAGLSTTGAPGPTGATGAAGPTGGIGEAPTDGQIYGRQSSSWTPVTSGGGGSDPETGLYLVDNFFNSALSASFLISQLPWNFQISGTASMQGAVGALFQSGSELSAMSFNTGSVTAIGDLTLGYVANAYNFVIPIGLGICTWKCKIAIDAIITSADALIDSIGLFRYNIAQGFYGGFFFEYNYAQSANWRCCVRTGTGTANVTYVDSGVAVAANTWFKLKVVTNATWTSFAFYINNALVATITTNVPTVAADMGVAPHFLQIRTAYANIRQIFFGYFSLNYPFTN